MLTEENMGNMSLQGLKLFPLMKGVPESLAGRMAIFQLYPLSWKDFPDADHSDVIQTRGANAQRILS